MIKLKEAIPALQVEGRLDDRLFEQLIRKFEIHKKLYADYDDNFLKPATEKEISEKEYSQLAVFLCLLAVQEKDLRFYNTALKISDRINIELPKIKF